MAAFAKFQKAVVSNIKPTLIAFLEKHRDELEKRFAAELAGRRASSAALAVPSRDERFMLKLLNFVEEVSNSLDRLRDIATYLRLPPPDHRLIKPAAYTRYHLESHYQEIYVLQDRLCQLATWLGRAYRKTESGCHIAEVAVDLEKYTKTCFGNAVTARGAHVHVERLDLPILRRLAMMELMAMGDRQLGRAYRTLQPFLSEKEGRRISAANRQITKVVNTVFGHVSVIVFDESGNVRYPSARPRA